MTAPFGGYKMSGNGREWGDFALRRVPGDQGRARLRAGIGRQLISERNVQQVFSAILIEKDETAQTVGVTSLEEAQLPEGDVTIDVEYSTLNYKDGLAITGKSPVVRKFPMVPGIDLAGSRHRELARRLAKRATASCSTAGAWAKPTGAASPSAPASTATGWSRCPSSFTARQAMAIGTAGYTASLCVDALLANRRYAPIRARSW